MILSILLFSPLVPFILILFLNEEQREIIKRVALSFSLVIILLTIQLYLVYDPQIATIQLAQSFAWIQGLGINFNIGIDGYSLILILASSFIYALAFILLSFSSYEKIKIFALGLFWAQFCTIGVFISLNGFLFYFFWELVIIPFYLFLGIYGDGNNTIKTSLKFFTYTMLGSLCMLVSMIYLSISFYNEFHVFSFDFADWAKLELSQKEQTWLFLAMSFAFLIKLPLMPFYTWQPDTYQQSPTISTLVLAGILSKLGIYGLYKIALPFFPDAALLFQDWIFYFALLSIIFGAVLALMQNNIKRLIAYSSISHLGFLVLGLFAYNEMALTGMFIQTVNHSIITAGLIYLVFLLEQKGRSAFIDDYKGLFQILPKFSVLFVFFVLASISLPGLSSFAGELFILFGLFHNHKIIALFSLVGIVLGAVYMLWLVRKLCFGEAKINQNLHAVDIRWRELMILVPAIIFILLIGIQPKLFSSQVEKVITHHIKISTQSLNAK